MGAMSELALVEPSPEVQTKPSPDGFGEVVLFPSPKLLPCPFCGDRRTEIKKHLRMNFEGLEQHEDAYHYYAFCPSCAATGGHSKSSPLGAARLWNMRTTLCCEWGSCTNISARERMDLGGSLWKVCAKHSLEGVRKRYWVRTRRKK